MAGSTSGTNRDLMTGNWSEHYTTSYYGDDYSSVGYNSFLSKSIDVQGQMKPDPTQVTLNTPQQYSNNAINYDFSQTSGSLGDIISIGSIRLDGSSGKISFIDEFGNEALILGNLDA